jgi:hypothetical protein
VQHGAGETGSAASQVLGAAQELSRHSNDLGREVATFLQDVKAASSEPLRSTRFKTTKARQSLAGLFSFPLR